MSISGCKGGLISPISGVYETSNRLSNELALLKDWYLRPLPITTIYTSRTYSSWKIHAYKTPTFPLVHATVPDPKRCISFHPIHESPGYSSSIAFITQSQSANQHLYTSTPITCTNSTLYKKEPTNLAPNAGAHLHVETKIQRTILRRM